MRAELRPGARVVYDGSSYLVEGLQGPLARLRSAEGEPIPVVVAVELLLSSPGYRLVCPEADAEAASRVPPCLALFLGVRVPGAPGLAPGNLPGLRPALLLRRRGGSPSPFDGPSARCLREPPEQGTGQEGPSRACMWPPAGRPSPRMWLDELGGVLGALAHLAHLEELGEVAEARAAAFSAHAATTLASGLRPALGSAPDPAVLAALLPKAVELLACSPVAFEAALRPLVERCLKGPIPHLTQARRQLGISGRTLQTQNWTVDYSVRRSVLGHMNLIMGSDWAWACWASGVHPGGGRRRRHASTWLWAALTGGHLNLAPTADRTHPSTEGDTYKRFLADDLPALEPALLALGANVLQRDDLSGPVRADLTGWGPGPEPLPRDVTSLGRFTARVPPAKSRRVAARGPAPLVGGLAELLGVALLSRLSGTSPKAIYRYRRGARWPGGTLHRRLLHLNDVIAALRQGHSDHQIAQWFSSEIAPGVRPTHLLEGSWSPDEEGPRRLLETARGDTSEDETRHSILVAEGPRTGRPRPALALVRELVDSQGLEQVANLTGVARLSIQRFLRGECWPGRRAQARFEELASMPQSGGGQG